MKISAILLMVYLCTFFASASKGQIITNGLVAEYLFDGNLNDSSGNGYNLTAGGTFNYVSNQDGLAGAAVQLVTADPSTGTFFLGTGPELANESSTVSFWVEKNYIGNGSNGSWVFGLGDPVGIGNSQGSDMHVALDYGSSIRYSFFYDDLNSSTPLPNNTWVNITATYDNSTGVRDIYINGTLDTTDVAAFPFTGSDNLKVGYQGISLSDLLFYDRALSPSEVLQISEIPEPPGCALLIAFASALFALCRYRRAPSVLKALVSLSPT